MARVANCAYCESWTEQISAAPCASCGKPTNGAPPVAESRSAEETARTAVAVIVSILSGVVILAILFVIAMPSGDERQRAFQKRTLDGIRTAGTLVEAYGRDHNRVYPHAESMDELQTLMIPRYGGAIPRLDAWGNDLRYGCTDDQCRGYAITSSGADRMFEYFYASKYPQDTTTNFDCDIVWVNGKFVQYPEDSSKR
jgi:hypothetical protein